MGMGAEMYMDMMIDAEVNAKLILEEYRQLFNKGLWKTRDGNVVPIKSMSSQHLRNTVAMINRNLSRYEKNLMTLVLSARVQMEEELRKRHTQIDPVDGNFPS